MATIDVVNAQGGKAGTVELDASVFEAPVKPHLFHAEVRRQLASRQSGTHATRNRARVSGGGAKPYRQKGTGRARQGTTRAPQFAGGGSVFGPVPRKHTHKLTKKMRRAALCGALSLRLGEEALTVVDALDLEEFKTRRVREALDAMGLGGSSVLIAIGDADEKLEISARNLAKVGVVRVDGLNVYDVLRHQRLLLTRGAVDKVHARLARAASGEEAAA